jgi:hypothetical protein
MFSIHTNDYLNRFDVDIDKLRYFDIKTYSSLPLFGKTQLKVLMIRPNTYLI